jgi:sterol desaturase/sphingolipid hydroxylase (fatty acid hydroxylase superfamily)
VSGFLISMMFSTLLAYVSYGAFLCLLAASEMGFPRCTLPSLKERWKAIQFGLIFIPAFIICGGMAGRIVFALGLKSPIDFEAMPILIGGLSYFLAYDFFYYWFHRAQHVVPWLWHIHAVHHSNEHLSAGFGYHHLAEAPTRALLVAIPFGILFDAPRGSAVLGFILVMHGYYIHSSSRLNFGPFAWLIADNRVHRIHHSLDPRHFDKNFGAATLIWDKLFGTAYWPKNEWPAIGLQGQRQPESIKEYLSLHTPVKTNDRAIHEIT